MAGRLPRNHITHGPPWRSDHRPSTAARPPSRLEPGDTSGITGCGRSPVGSRGPRSTAGVVARTRSEHGPGSAARTRRCARRLVGAAARSRWLRTVVRLGGVDQLIDDHGRTGIGGGHGCGPTLPCCRLRCPVRVPAGPPSRGYRPQGRRQDLDGVISPEIVRHTGGVAHPAFVLGTVVAQVPAVRRTRPGGVGRTQVIGLWPTFVGESGQHRLLLAVAEHQRGPGCRRTVGPCTPTLVRPQHRRPNRRPGRRHSGRDRTSRDAGGAHLLCCHGRHAKPQPWKPASTRPRGGPPPIPALPRIDVPREPGCPPGTGPWVPLRHPTGCCDSPRRSVAPARLLPAWSAPCLTTLGQHGRSPRATPPRQP